MTPKEEAESLGIKVDGRWSDDRVQQEIDSKKLSESVAETPISKFESLEWANNHAKAIWSGQSSSLSLIDRVARIRAALKEKGFTDFDNLVIPTSEDYRKYL